MFERCMKRNKEEVSQSGRPIEDMKDEGHDTVEQTKVFETAFLNPHCYEKLSPDIDVKEIGKQLLKISNLHKEYDNGFKAVNGINVKMYSDQIFCLLGHNGAGKTTTIQMLTGMINSTQGSVNLFGVDIFN